LVSGHLDERGLSTCSAFVDCVSLDNDLNLVFFDQFEILLDLW
jgi:hypothetical protein